MGECLNLEIQVMYVIESGSIWPCLRSVLLEWRSRKAHNVKSVTSVEMPQEEGPIENVCSNVMERIVP
jgi:hypothetical protein